jgi:hypothetical protein
VSPSYPWSLAVAHVGQGAGAVFAGLPAGGSEQQDRAAGEKWSPMRPLVMRYRLTCSHKNALATSCMQFSVRRPAGVNVTGDPRQVSAPKRLRPDRYTLGTRRVGECGDAMVASGHDG